MNSPGGPDPEKLKRAILTPGDFSTWLGTTVESVGGGSAVLRATIRKDMLNGLGVCHGGILFSLADTAVALAAHTREKVSMSIEGSVSFIEAVREGDSVMVEAVETGLKNRLGFYSVSIRKIDNTPVATFHATVFRTSKPFQLP